MVQHKHCTDNFNRVVLNTIPGEKHSDYINASYVDVRVTHKLASVYNMKYN